MDWYEIEHEQIMWKKFNQLYIFKPSSSSFAKAIKPRDKAVVFKEYTILSLWPYDDDEGLTQAYLDGEAWTKRLFMQFFGEEMCALDWNHPWRKMVTVVGTELVAYIEENGCPFLE